MKTHILDLNGLTSDIVRMPGTKKAAIPLEICLLANLGLQMLFFYMRCWNYLELQRIIFLFLSLSFF